MTERKILVKLCLLSFMTVFLREHGLKNLRMSCVLSVFGFLLGTARWQVIFLRARYWFSLNACRNGCCCGWDIRRIEQG